MLVKLNPVCLLKKFELNRCILWRKCIMFYSNFLLWYRKAGTVHVADFETHNYKGFGLTKNFSCSFSLDNLYVGHTSYCCSLHFFNFLFCWIIIDSRALFTRDILTHNIVIKRYSDKKIFSRHWLLLAKVSS